VLQPTAPQTSIHVYEVRPRSDKRGVDLISDALPFGRLVYGGPKIAAGANQVINSALPEATDLSAAFSGEFCNSRDASVHADGSKSRFSNRFARALWRRNSLRAAMQNGGGRPYPGFRLRDCGSHPAQTEQGAQTA
jgi:hypothetical protein